MPNPVKGEIPLVLSDGRKLMLVADMEATIEAETLYGKPAAKMAEDAKNGFIGAIRALFWGMLRRHHPTMTPADATLLLADHMPEIEDGMNRASEAATPKTAEGENSPNPRRPKGSLPAGKISGRSGAKRVSNRKTSGGRPPELSI